MLFRSNLVDFLPFKCQHCGQSYCGEHYLPDKHACESYDATKFDRVAPQCKPRLATLDFRFSFANKKDGNFQGPLCNTTIAIPPDENPNIRMERHISLECSVTNGDRAVQKKAGVPTCARHKCNKKLYAPISCDVRPSSSSFSFLFPFFPVYD